MLSTVLSGDPDDQGRIVETGGYRCSLRSPTKRIQTGRCLTALENADESIDAGRNQEEEGEDKEISLFIYITR